jgi:Uncharacterized protein conserved in bacteria (DUF2188)
MAEHKSTGRSQPKRQVFEVEPRDDGKFALQREKSQRASRVFEKKSDAVKEGARRGREIEKNGGLAELRIKGDNGRIQDERTYGKDPRRSRG